MYAFALTLHSYLRWFVLLALILAISRSFDGILRKRNFTKTDDLIRHWTATIGHIQLMAGMLVYTQSPAVAYFWKNKSEAFGNLDAVFFGVIHFGLMATAIVLMTIASAKARRQPLDKAKFQTMSLYFSLAFFVILIAIPWPFSPLAQRPYLR